MPRQAVTHKMPVFTVGVAGCVATLLHDAIMNPAEGKTSYMCAHTHAHTCFKNSAFFKLCGSAIWTLEGAPDSAEPLVLRLWVNRFLRVTFLFLSHGHVTVCPAVVKQRLQMFNSPYGGVLHCVGSLLRQEGAAAFYRSYTTQLTMNVPFQALHFMTYEYLQELLNPHRQYNPSSHMLSGALAGAVAAAATTPLDVCKTLLNTQEAQTIHVMQTGVAAAPAPAARHISGLGEAFRAVYRMGGVPAFFKGVQARVIYQMPSTAISWSVYEFFKYIITKRRHERRLHTDGDK